MNIPPAIRDVYCSGDTVCLHADMCSSNIDHGLFFLCFARLYLCHALGMPQGFMIRCFVVDTSSSNGQRMSRHSCS